MTAPTRSGPRTTGAVRVALLGAGVVGSQVIRLMAEHADDLAARIGAPLELVGVAVREPGRVRDLGVDDALITGDAAALVAQDGVDVVVEVVGGVDPARAWLLSAFAHGKHVVTANKALLATHGAELHEAAAAAQRDLYFEASVAGGIPLLRPLKESLAGDRLHRVLGIVNGTTNFILSRMADSGASFADALAEATALGFAETDPTADVEGFDAAAKAAILASIAFHTRVSVDDVHREGITAITSADVATAREMGRVVKLLAVCERSPAGVSVRVHPAMIPLSHPLASVREAYNAVFVEGDAVGELMFYGRGAGGAPTASAVLGDLVAVARDIVGGSRGVGESSYAQLPIVAMGDVVTRYYVSLDVADKPGVLASVANAFADRDVSIQTVRQEGHGDDARLVLVTHRAPDAALSATVETLRGMAAVRAVAGVMRVEGEGGR